MFWRKKKNCAGAAVYVGGIGSISMVECTPQQEAFKKSVAQEVERRLAYIKAHDAHAALPDYKIVTSYDVIKNEDTYHLQSKQWNDSFYNPSSYYHTFYSSTDKAGIDARFKRLQQQIKKAA